MTTTATHTPVEPPSELARCRPSVRAVYAILATADGPLWPRGIVAAWERDSDDFQSVDTVNHALRDLRNRGLACTSPAGWVVQTPAPPPLLILTRFLMRR